MREWGDRNKPRWPPRPLSLSLALSRSLPLSLSHTHTLPLPGGQARAYSPVRCVHGLDKQSPFAGPQVSARSAPASQPANSASISKRGSGLFSFPFSLSPRWAGRSVMLLLPLCVCVSVRVCVCARAAPPPAPAPPPARSFPPFQPSGCAIGCGFAPPPRSPHIASSATARHTPKKSQSRGVPLPRSQQSKSLGLWSLPSAPAVARARSLARQARQAGWLEQPKAQPGWRKRERKRRLRYGGTRQWGARPCAYVLTRSPLGTPAGAPNSRRAKEQAPTVCFSQERALGDFCTYRKAREGAGSCGKSIWKARGKRRRGGPHGVPLGALGGGG